MEQQMKDDYNAITWAWKLLKDNYKTSDDPEYWNGIMREVAEHNNDGIAWQCLGAAVGNILDYRHQSMRQYGDIDHASQIHLDHCRMINEK